MNEKRTADIPGKMPYTTFSEHCAFGEEMALTKSARTDRKMERLEARLPADIKAIIQHAADLTGRSLSDFVVTSAREAAEEAIREHEVIVLSARDSLLLVETLLNPKGPNEALLAAARRHRELLGPME